MQSVLSLTNAPDPIANVVDPPLLIPQIPTDPAALTALRRKIKENPIYLNVVSQDGKGAAVILYFKNLSDDEFLQKRVDEHLQEIMAREQGPEKLYLTGMQSIKANSFKLMQQDLWTFTPLSCVVIMGVLGFCLASFFAPFAPIAWFAGQTYENRFRALGIEPADAIRLGKRLGMIATFLIVLEVVVAGSANNQLPNDSTPERLSAKRPAERRSPAKCAAWEVIAAINLRGR